MAELYELFPRMFAELTPMQQLYFDRLPYRAAPDFLGEFSFLPYPAIEKLPPVFFPLVAQMSKLAPGQSFNRAFVQRYQPGEFVRPHRDPRNNVGYTIIAVFGQFDGAETDIAGDRFTMEHGDVLKLSCTIDGEQGPIHSVSPITSGTRYALILNTVVS